MTPNWFRFEKSTPDQVDIFIIDFIGDWVDDYWGFGTTARSFMAQLEALPDSIQKIRVLINSPGGDVYSGITIANALRMQHAERGRVVETHVMGIAASSASLILMGGSRITAASNAIVMIHDPWTRTQGNAKQHAQAIARLDSIRDAGIETYKWHSSLSKTALSDMMKEEAYLTAEEAKAHGFVHEITDAKESVEKAFPAAVVAGLRLPSRFQAFAKQLTQPPRTFSIAKADPLKKQCFGWASVAMTVDGQPVVDGHQHIIEPNELEQAAYKFAMHYRDMDGGHTDPVVGVLIESLVVTPEKLEAMGLASNAMPQGWWVGFQVTDDAVFKKVLSGEYAMFSIAGTASTEDVK